MCSDESRDLPDARGERITNLGWVIGAEGEVGCVHKWTVSGPGDMFLRSFDQFNGF